MLCRIYIGSLIKNVLRAKVLSLSSTAMAYILSNKIADTHFSPELFSIYRYHWGLKT